MRHEILFVFIGASVLGMPGQLHAGSVPVSVDGLFDDWSAVPVSHDDGFGDGSGDVDFGRVWLTNDNQFLFLRVEMGNEVDLSENNDLRLYLDTDVNSHTGLAIGGIGAELEWWFGERFGVFRMDGSTATVYHDDIRFRSGPTVTANQFEMAIDLNSIPDGVHALFNGPNVRVLLQEVGGDQLPDEGQLVYTLGGRLPDEAPRTLDKAPGDVRVITWNVLNDSIFDPGQQPKFERQVKAVAPDILNFQEIYNSSPGQVRQLVAQWLPGGTWYAAGNNDVHTISRYAITDAFDLDGNLAVVLDTTSVFGSETLLINAHLPCCGNDDGRQDEIDRIMAFIRDAKMPGGQVSLSADAPIMIVGDMNLVGLSQQLESLLNGDIVSEGSFGSDFAPDWDGSNFDSIVSRQLEKRMGYTWRSDSSSFWPGHLDFIIISDSVVQTTKDFLLYTPELSVETLGLYGLQADDSLASDHILFGADMRPAGSPYDINGDGTVDVDDLIAVILAWGPCPPPPCNPDTNADQIVDVDDLVGVILNWST